MPDTLFLIVFRFFLFYTVPFASALSVDNYERNKGATTYIIFVLFIISRDAFVEVGALMSPLKTARYRAGVWLHLGARGFHAVSFEP